ncbi:hypothetical protein CHY_0184 [Carboxydothermus hydrogenoformans Z-2901]|uniref:Uncharacterized protein n=1 Tax=Carboxydothermus hydrogenoformans (strain ATCC BAA-161 / DSM 6008 / Z-2901) TaxID=246194 RepID=Q3AFM8_CARHZ|nr:hypothetical protein CHY_0184 [Carboxydothermus hydrogenoformans Z-2901]
MMFFGYYKSEGKCPASFFPNNVKVPTSTPSFWVISPFRKTAF